MKKKYYLVLDTETATLPFAENVCGNSKERQTMAIAKPLVYDIGWVVCDRQGNICEKKNFLIQETFFVPNIFNTAYYKEKRPLYMDMLHKGEITCKKWNEVVEILLADLRKCDIATAYNACFDFKKAIPFTERYIYHLYRSDYNDWERKQKNHCERLISGKQQSDDKNPNYLKPIFKLRGEEFCIADLWGLACDRLINIDKYRNYCIENKLLSPSVEFFKTSAEVSYRYLMGKYDFIEDHTALSDSLIEAEILTKALKKGKVEPYITAFPFKKIGTTFDYVAEKKPKYAEIILTLFEEYLTAKGVDLNESQRGYWSVKVRQYDRLKNLEKN